MIPLHFRLSCARFISLVLGLLVRKSVRFLECPFGCSVKTGIRHLVLDATLFLWFSQVSNCKDMKKYYNSYRQK